MPAARSLGGANGTSFTGGVTPMPFDGLTIPSPRSLALYWTVARMPVLQAVEAGPSLIVFFRAVPPPPMHVVILRHVLTDPHALDDCSCLVVGHPSDRSSLPLTISGVPSAYEASSIFSLLLTFSSFRWYLLLFVFFTCSLSL